MTPDDFVSTLPADSVLDAPTDFRDDDTRHSAPNGTTAGGAGEGAPPARRLTSVADRPLEPITGLLSKAVHERLQFTGTGKEYFRIWVVNALLSLLTLGLYSAWAKQRKLRWFARHTVLAGEPFDFHGKPWRILMGRALALSLLVAYSHAFQWSQSAGWAMLGVLYLFGPALFAGAQRFRLGNTSWRGVRFGFRAGAAVVYASCLPLIAAWTLAFAGVSAGVSKWVVGIATLAVFALYPLAHGWLKRFQHQHAVYGDRPFKFDFSVRGFYGLYLAMIGLVALVMLGSGAVTTFLLAFFPPAAFGVDPKLVSAALSVGTGAITLILAWPTYVARLQRLVWLNTRLADGIEFKYDLPAGALVKVLATHGLLVPLTLGLSWPFLAVRLARLRIEALSVLADEPLNDIIVSARPAERRGAVGDAAADAFGLDLGW